MKIVLTQITVRNLAQPQGKGRVGGECRSGRTVTGGFSSVGRCARARRKAAGPRGANEDHPRAPAGRARFPGACGPRRVRT